MSKKIKRGIYPGTFDPVTYGHIDLIKRALRVFDEVIVAVAPHGSGKEPLFSLDERVAMIQKTTRDLKGVTVLPFEGLVVDFARQKKASSMIRGVRMISDFEYEFQMALTNRKLADDIETIFLMPHEAYAYLSSRLIKELASLGADIRSFAPSLVVNALINKYKDENRR